MVKVVMNYLYDTPDHLMFSDSPSWYIIAFIMLAYPYFYYSSFVDTDEFLFDMEEAKEAG